MGVYIGRYYLIHQRLRRRRGWYRPSTIDATTREDVIEVCLFVHSSASCRRQSSEVESPEVNSDLHPELSRDFHRHCVIEGDNEHARHDGGS